MKGRRNKRSQPNAAINGVGSNGAGSPDAADLFNVIDDEALQSVTESCVPSSPGKNVLTVHNVLASASFSSSAAQQRLDLDKCCLALGNSYYNPAEFPALSSIFRLQTTARFSIGRTFISFGFRIDVRGKRPNSLFSVSLFESGRIQSTGGCEPMEAKRAMHKIARRLNQRCGYGLSLQNFEIQNILAVYDYNKPISLPRFVRLYRSSAIDYEPERFPAARVRVPIPAKGSVASDQQQNNSSSADPLEADAAILTQRASAKLRKLMIGGPSHGYGLLDADEETEGQDQVREGVGSYIIRAGSKRASKGGKGDEKAPREEVVTANVFSTGKITLTGAKSISSLRTAVSQIQDSLE